MMSSSGWSLWSQCAGSASIGSVISTYGVSTDPVAWQITISVASMGAGGVSGVVAPLPSDPLPSTTGTVLPPLDPPDVLDPSDPLDPPTSAVGAVLEPP